MAGAISGPGTVRQDGPGTLELTGSNSHGQTVITAGTLGVGSDTALGTGPITITGGGIRASGAPRDIANTLALDGSFTLGRLTNFSGNALLGADITITSANPDVGTPTSSTFSGVISGARRLTFDAGANPIGTIVLSGANTYSGGTTLTAGTLSLGNSAALGTGGLAVDGGTLDLGGNTISVAGLSGSGGVITSGSAGAVTLTADQAASTTYGGILQNGSGTLALTKAGAGTLTLLGDNTYTGATTLTGGTLQIGNGGTAGSIASASVSNGGTLAFSRSDAVAYGGVISGAGGLVQLGPGTLTLTGTNTYTGDTTLAAGTLSLGSAGALGTGGRINFTGGALQFTSTNTTDPSARFGTADNQLYRLDTNGQAVTLASDLTSAGGSLTKLGLGTLILAGGNSYTGGTVVEAGTLQFTNTPVIGNLTLNGGALDLGGRNLTIADLSGGSSASIINGAAGSATLTADQAATTTYAGTLQDGVGPLTLPEDRPGHAHAQRQQQLHRRHHPGGRHACPRQRERHRHQRPDVLPRRDAAIQRRQHDRPLRSVQHRRGSGLPPRHERAVRHARLQPRQRGRLARQARRGHADPHRQQHLRRRHPHRPRHVASRERRHGGRAREWRHRQRGVARLQSEHRDDRSRRDLRRGRARAARLGKPRPHGR